MTKRQGDSSRNLSLSFFSVPPGAGCSLIIPSAAERGKGEFGMNFTLLLTLPGQAMLRLFVSFPNAHAVRPVITASVEQ